jgi:hypothetical protein
MTPEIERMYSEVYYVDIYKERIRALELAIEFHTNKGLLHSPEDVVFTANKFFDFITFNEPVQEDPETIESLLVRVAQCPVEFAKTLKITNIDGKVEGVFPYNLDYIQQLHDNNRVVAASSRQLGSTLSLAIYCLWRAMYNNDEVVAILSSNYNHCLSLMDHLRRTYEGLPVEIKTTTTAYNKGSVEFSNGSKIVARAFSPDALRGLSFSTLAIDNAAFVPHSLGNLYLEAEFPLRLSMTPRVIVQSCANTTCGFFSQIWDEAVAGQNGFHTIQRLWNEDPRKTSAWKDEMVKQIGERNFQRDFEVQFQPPKKSW